MTDRVGQGQAAETIACDFLLSKGLQLVTRNYRCRRGELDLVMRDSDTLVFVEVRSRRPTRFADAASSIDHHKQTRLLAAAQHYLQRFPPNQLPPCRFDVIAITLQQGSHQIDWITNAIEG